MEIAIGIAALILAILTINSDRILFVVRLILCSITCYYTLKYYCGTIHIWSSIEYTQNNFNIFITHGLAFKCITYLLLSYLCFYCLLPYLINISISKFIYTKINLLYEQLNKSQIIGALRLTRKAIKSKLIKKSIDKLLDTTVDDYNECKNQINNTFTLSIHLIICWFLLDINNNLYIKIILIVYLVVIFLLFILMPINQIIKNKLQ